MKKAILGGTFDPIHIGHINIAYEALYRLHLDKVIFIPNGHPPHKDNDMVSESAIRYEMVSRAIENEEKFVVSDYEINKNKSCYTYETMTHFSNVEPDTEWYFIAGVDSLMTLDTWKNLGVIMEKCTLVILSRDGYNLDEVYRKKAEFEEEYEKEIIMLETPLIDISSTEIREKILHDEKVYYLLPEGVEEVINKYNLYKR